MRHKFLLCVVLIFVGLFVPLSYSANPVANPTYTCTLANDTQLSDTVYEFDIYLLRTGGTPFELVLFQGGFFYNDAVKNGGTLTWVNFVPGSSDASLVTSGQVNTNFNATTAGVIKIAPKPPAGGPGTGAIISNIPPGTKIGRLHIKNSISFASLTPDFKFSNNPAVAYAIKIFGNVSGNSTEITDTTQHFVTLGNPVLPVELTSFVSNVSGRQVNLNWETKTEVNSSKYEIDRALVSTKDATVTWASVGIVPASGNSSAPKKYSYTEKNLQAGKYQYRLKMIDNSGSYKFSDIVETEIALPKNFELSQNYPNPFNPSTRINYSLPFDSRVTLEVYNITGERMGQIVNEEQSAGYYIVNFSSSTLNRSIASGVYIYKINAIDKSTGNVFSSIKKMMLLK